MDLRMWFALLSLMLLLQQLSPAEARLASRKTPARACNVQENTYPFDEALAKKMMQYSSVAYHERTNLLDWNCALCKGPLRQFASPFLVQAPRVKLFAYGGYDCALGQVIIVFRGTVPRYFKNIVADFRVARTKPSIFPMAVDNGAQVHKGFYKSYLRLRDDLRLKLRVLLSRYGRDGSRSLKVHVTGHSLGAALATLAALDFVVNSAQFGILRDQRTPAIRAVVMTNFGSPKVGNKCFASYYSQQVKMSLRVANKDDIVTKTPPTWLSNGYTHVPRLISTLSGARGPLAPHSRYLGVHTEEGSARRKRRK